MKYIFICEMSRAENTAPKRAERRYQAPALDKGLEILEYLSGQRTPLTQLEIAKGLRRSSGEIYRLLLCLEERGYLAREAKSGKFRLTLRLYELAHSHNPTMLLRRAARMPMEALAEKIEQACHLSAPYGTSLLVLMECMPSRRICLAVGEGTVLPMILTTSGKLMLSRMDGDSAKALLDTDAEYRAMSEAKRRALLRQLETARGTELLKTESGLRIGITDIAVPVGIEGTDAFAILAISCLPGIDEKPACAALRRCASQINRNLGLAT
jgi:DNA-binding IclR family transcriptional regulator